MALDQKFGYHQNYEEWSSEIHEHLWQNLDSDLEKLRWEIKNFDPVKGAEWKLKQYEK